MCTRMQSSGAMPSQGEVQIKYAFAYASGQTYQSGGGAHACAIDIVILTSRCGAGMHFCVLCVNKVCLSRVFLHW